MTSFPLVPLVGVEETSSSDGERFASKPSQSDESDESDIEGKRYPVGLSLRSGLGRGVGTLQRI